MSVVREEGSGAEAILTWMYFSSLGRKPVNRCKGKASVKLLLARLYLVLAAYGSQTLVAP